MLNLINIKVFPGNKMVVREKCTGCGDFLIPGSVCRIRRKKISLHRCHSCTISGK